MKLRKGACCNYCRRTLDAPSARGKLGATRDHVVPRSKWTPIDRIYGSQIVWACRQCNMLKRDMMPNEWSAFMRENPEWWRRPEWQYGSNVKAKAVQL